MSHDLTFYLTTNIQFDVTYMCMVVVFNVNVCYSYLLPHCEPLVTQTNMTWFHPTLCLLYSLLYIYYLLIISQ